MRSFRFRPSQFARSLAEEPKHSAARKKPLAPRVRLCLLKNWKWTWQITRSFRESFVCGIWNTGLWNLKYSSRNPESRSGADPGFCLGGGALISCSTSTPINHIVFFFWQNTSCIRKPQVISGGVRTPCTLPLDPPLPLKMESRIEVPLKKKNRNPVPGIWNPWLGIQNLRLSWIEKKKRHVSSLVSLLSLLFVRSHYLQWFSGPLDINFIGL